METCLFSVMMLAFWVGTLINGIGWFDAIGSRYDQVADVHYPAAYVALAIFLVVEWILTLVGKCANMKGDTEKEADALVAAIMGFVFVGIPAYVGLGLWVCYLASRHISPEVGDDLRLCMIISTFPFIAAYRMFVSGSLSMLAMIGAILGLGSSRMKGRK